ncbi:MAG: J domain-containing protein [Candidatus Firestonebacteria bacterium]
MEYKNYYDILGIDKQADAKTITSAYRKLAKKHHPDYNPGDKKAEDKFKEINEAYEVLSDKSKREKYDSIGSDWNNWQQYAQGQPHGRQQQYGGYTSSSGNFDESVFGEGGFSDFFRTFFGGAGKERTSFDSFNNDYSPAEEGSYRGDIDAKIELDLKDAYLGGERTFQLSVQEECYTCGGRGVISRNQSCSACAGNGISVKVKKLTVKIPPCIKNGSKIRIAGQGNKGRNGKSGDLYLSVKIRPHHFFELEGNNLSCELPVSVTELALGANIEVPTFKSRVTVKVPRGTQNGSVFRLKGMGFCAAGTPGDLLVKLKVHLQKNLSEKERTLFEELRKLEKENPRRGLSV